MRIQEEKIELQKKKYIEEFVWGTSIFRLHAPPSYVLEKKCCSRKWWRNGVYFSPRPPRPNVYGPVKAPFLTKKTSAVKSDTGFSREATEN